MSYSDNADILNIKFKIKNTKFCKSFSIPLIDVDMEVMNVPSIEYQCEFKILSKILSDIMSNLEIFNDIMTFTCNEEFIKMESLGIDGTMNINIPIDDVNEYAIEEDEIIKSKFSLSYFNKICSFNKISDETMISISKNYPLEVKYNLDKSNNTEDSNSDNGNDIIENYFRFCLAPKIDDDDNDNDE